MNKKQKQAISEYYRNLAKKGVKKRHRKILQQSKVADAASKAEINNQSNV